MTKKDHYSEISPGSFEIRIQEPPVFKRD